MALLAGVIFRLVGMDPSGILIRWAFVFEGEWAIVGGESPMCEAVGRKAIPCRALGRNWADARAVLVPRPLGPQVPGELPDEIWLRKLVSLETLGATSPRDFPRQHQG